MSTLNTLRRKLHTRTLKIFAAAAAACLGLTALPAQAQTPGGAASYPTRPITLLLPYSAGGPTDLMARQLAQGLAKELGQPVVVENRTGAAGLVALGALARAPADGYLLGVMASPVTAIAPLTQPNFPYDVVTSFTPITDVVNYSLVLMVGKHVPANNVRELIEYAKKNPEAVTYGSSGVGGTNHLAGELLSRASKAPMLHVPYKGNALAVNDILGGQISFVFDMPNTAQAQARSGQLRPLAITSSQRNPMLPDVPTLVESGFPDVVVEGWYGVLAPANLPAPVLRRLESAIKAVKASPRFAEQMQSGGFVLTPTSSSAFGERIRKERDFWKNLITTANIKLQ
jgi:tripartite-type tricarboxylate transporter receptor subunit TctC